MFLLYTQLFILILLAFLNIWLGVTHGLYETIWWWDIPTHFLGGVWVGLFAAWLLEKRDKEFTVLSCALFALSVGVVWEIFEYTFGIGGSPFMGYWADTIKDVCMDVIGGMTAGAIAYAERDLWRK